MAQDLGGKVYILSREVYDEKVDQSEINNGSIYLVSETTEENPQILSMYLGLAKQTDILDITPIANTWETPIDFTNLSDNYNIPNDYQIPNKLFFYKQDAVIDTSGETDIVLSDAQYRLIAWHEAIDENDTSRFLDCGIPQTTVICPNGLPTTGQGVKNNVYIVTKPGEKSLHIFDGTDYIEVLAGGTLIPDNLTILVNPSTNEIHGVGADMSGKSVMSGQTEIIVGDGASIFNDYSNNVCIGEYSNVFGKNNAERAVASNAAKTNACNTIFGKNNSINSNAEDNFVCGNGQMIACTNASCNTLLGNNTLTGATVKNNFIFGNNGNTSASQPPLASSSIQNCFIGGKANSVTSSLDTAFMFGESNSVSGAGGSNIIFMFGYGNSFTSSSLKSVEGCVVIGTGNTVQSTTYYQHNGGCLVCGNGLQLIAHPGRTFLGSYNDTTTFVNNDPRVFCIGIGSSADRADGLRFLTNGILHVCASNGNVVTENGIKLASTRTTDSTILADDSAYTFSILPNNGSEIILSNFYTIGDITITSTSNMTYESINQYGQWSSLSKQTSGDYNSVIIFKKSSTKTTASELIENFTDSNLPRIYLLNPDIDISNFTIIHILLFNDGFNICAIVSGYEEEA